MGRRYGMIFKNIKSKMINHWLPHFEIKSGEDLDDAIERVRCHVFAYRANKNTKWTQSMLPTHPGKPIFSYNPTT